MIQLDISVALFLFLFCTVVVTFILWIWVDRRSDLGDFKAKREEIWQCSICRHVYVDPKNEDFSRCPRCKSINTRREKTNERGEGVRNL
jgi:uncharacterized paraquat-inducible protein A